MELQPKKYAEQLEQLGQLSLEEIRERRKQSKARDNAIQVLTHNGVMRGVDDRGQPLVG